MNALTLEQLTGHQELELHPEVRLLPEAAEAFIKMQNDAYKDSLRIVIVSGYRSYEQQKAIWNRKVTKLKETLAQPEARIAQILKFSAIPGTSRHHFGTDLDVVTEGTEKEEDPLIPEYFTQPHHKNFQLFIWLLKYGARYGFYHAYPLDPSRSGFMHEPWHLSFAGLSKHFLKSYLEGEWQKAIQPDELGDGELINETFLKRYRLEHLLGIHLKLLP